MLKLRITVVALLPVGKSIDKQIYNIFTSSSSKQRESVNKHKGN